MPFVVFASDGLSGGAYEPGVNCVQPPKESVQISDADWTDWLTHAGQRQWNGTAIVSYTPTVDLVAYAAAAHIARRDGGVTIAGMVVKTDSESRSLINGAYSLSEVRPDALIDFKAASGWVSLDAATVQTVAVAVGAWVQACYSAYRAVSGSIAAGTITTPAQIDAAFAAVALPG